MPDDEDSEPLSNNNNNADNSPEVKDEAEEANIIQRRSRTTAENPTPRVKPEPKDLEKKYADLERDQPDQQVKVNGDPMTVKPKGWHLEASNQHRQANGLPAESAEEFLKRNDIDKTRYFNEQERQQKKVTFTDITADEIKAEEQAALEPGKKLPQNYEAKPNVSLHHMQPQQQPAPVVQQPQAQNNANAQNAQPGVYVQDQGNAVPGGYIQDQGPAVQGNAVPGGYIQDQGPAVQGNAVPGGYIQDQGPAVQGNAVPGGYIQDQGPAVQGNAVPGGYIQDQGPAVQGNAAQGNAVPGGYIQDQGPAVQGNAVPGGYIQDQGPAVQGNAVPGGYIQDQGPAVQGNAVPGGYIQDQGPAVQGNAVPGGYIQDQGPAVQGNAQPGGYVQDQGANVQGPQAGQQMGAGNLNPGDGDLPMFNVNAPNPAQEAEDFMAQFAENNAEVAQPLPSIPRRQNNVVPAMFNAPEPVVAKEPLLPDGKAIQPGTLNPFVLAPNGEVYTENLKDTSAQIDGGPRVTVHHSSFLSGAPVAGAGELRLDGSGRLKEMTDRSGHHLPPSANTVDTLQELEDLGVDLDKVKFTRDRGIPGGPQDKKTGMANEYMQGAPNLKRDENGNLAPSAKHPKQEDNSPWRGAGKQPVDKDEEQARKDEKLKGFREADLKEDHTERLGREMGPDEQPGRNFNQPYQEPNILQPQFPKNQPEGYGAGKNQPAPQEPKAGSVRDMLRGRPKTGSADDQFVARKNMAKEADTNFREQRIEQHLAAMNNPAPGAQNQAPALQDNGVVNEPTIRPSRVREMVKTQQEAQQNGPANNNNQGHSSSKKGNSF